MFLTHKLVEKLRDAQIKFKRNDAIILFIFQAAQCFQSKGQQEMLSPEYLSAVLGQNNLSDSDENEAKTVDVWEIILHPDWNINSEKYDADLAVVVLKEPVVFNANIQPICLPESSYEEVTGSGPVVGW